VVRVACIGKGLRPAPSLQPGDGEIEIQLRSGARILADKVVLALGNFRPVIPTFQGGIQQAARRSRDLYFSSPWSDTSFEGVEHLDSVLLLGSGLTSVDVAVELLTKDSRARSTSFHATVAASLPQSA